MIWSAKKNGPQALLSSHLSIVNLGDKQSLSGIVWDIFQECYDKIGGLRTFDSTDDMITESLLWKIVYFGPLEDYSEFDRDKVLAMAAYKQRAGLKRVADASNRTLTKTGLRDFVIAGYRKLVVLDFKKAWVESSGHGEKFLINHGGLDYVIPIEKVRLAFPGREIIPDEDGMHYTRRIGDKLIRKIAISKIRV